MENIINLTKLLDKVGEYHACDHLFKTAFDVEKYTNQEVGSGGFGAFYELPRNSKELGRDPNLGLKVFHSRSWKSDLQDNIREFVFFKLLGPLINAHTPFRAPVTEAQSLSSFISNKAVVSQKMPGININNTINWKNGVVGYKIRSKLMKTLNTLIEDDLMNSLGIEWNDCYPGNYLLGPLAVNKFKVAVEEIEKSFNFTDDPSVEEEDLLREEMNRIGPALMEGVISTNQVYIVDFGLMNVIDGTIAGNTIKKYYKNLRSNPAYSKNKWVKKIVKYLKEGVK